LTSGADYRDLSHVLPEACDTLIGVIPRDGNGMPSPAGAFTAGDCDQVRSAVLAVEMNKYPADQRRMPATPRMCPVGYTPARMLSDNFNDGSLAPKWSSSGWRTDAGFQPSPSAGRAAFASDHSDVGRDPATANPADRRLTTSSKFRIPTGRASFLRWQHAYGLDWWGTGHTDLGFPDHPIYWDGGFVEVSVAGHPFKPLKVTRNGYKQPIDIADNRLGFGGDSIGWYTSQAALSSFAGRSVKLRFRLLTDGFIAFSPAAGWWLDNVSLYSCRGPSAPAAVKVSNVSGPKVKMSWHASTPNAGFSIKSYVVRRSGASAKTLSAHARSTVFGGLTKGKTYAFSIYATNNAGAKGTTVTKRLRVS
jgi:Fibronectin type III domain